jgi:hypothetical protein
MISFRTKRIMSLIATSVAVLFVGFGSSAGALSDGSSETFSSPATGLAVTSDTSAAKVTCPTGLLTCKWVVAGVTSNSGEAFRPWWDCGGWSSSPYPGTASCSITLSQGHTTTAAVTGTDSVGIGALSSAVGYSVTKTIALQSGWSTTVPAETNGVIQASSVYNDLKTVKQQYDYCYVNRYAGINCVLQPIYAYAHTELYSHVRYQTVLTGPNNNIAE